MTHVSQSTSKAQNQSRLKSAVQSVVSLSYAGRKSVAWRGDKGGFKVPKYQNSYRLEAHLPFKSDVSDKILIDVMMKMFKDTRYDKETSVTTCRDAAASVLDRLYKTDYDRVKYVVMMSVIEKVDQGFSTMNGRLWDPIRDTYSFFVHEASNFYATGMVYAMYYE